MIHRGLSYAQERPRETPRMRGVSPLIYMSVRAGGGGRWREGRRNGALLRYDNAKSFSREQRHLARDGRRPYASCVRLVDLRGALAAPFYHVLGESVAGMPPVSGEIHYALLCDRAPDLASRLLRAFAPRACL